MSVPRSDCMKLYRIQQIDSKLFKPTKPMTYDVYNNSVYKGIEHFYMLLNHKVFKHFNKLKTPTEVQCHTNFCKGQIKTDKTNAPSIKFSLKIKKTNTRYLFQLHIKRFCEGFSAEVPEAFISRIHAHNSLQQKPHWFYYFSDNHIHCHRHVHTLI